jgi:hypothetical protein
MRKALAGTLAALAALTFLSLSGPAHALPPPQGVTARFYENTASNGAGLLGGWSLDIHAPGCDSGGPQDLDGVYDNSLSWIDFGSDGLGCEIVLYDGPGGTGTSHACTAAASCQDVLTTFNDQVSSYKVAPAPCLVPQ